MTSSAWLWALALLPATPVILAFIWRGVPWHPRWPAADLFRIGTGIAFAGWVHPALAVLALQGGFWWIKAGWLRAPGGLQWPLIAMALLLVIQAPLWSVHLAVALILAMGVIQTLLAFPQVFGRIIFINRHIANKLASAGFQGRYVHGTLGHRTGLAMYLACLIPMAFLAAPPWSYVLAAVYGMGIVLTMSSVGAAAGVAGLLWVMPTLWQWAAMLLVIGIAVRMVKPQTPDEHYGHYLKIRSFDHLFVGRVAIWKATLGRALSWPAWLRGHGPGSFDQHGRLWNREYGLREIYREVHNDYLEFFYEHGLVGLGCLALFGWSLFPALRVGDPLVGVLVGFAVAMAVNFPCRVTPIGSLALLAIGILMR